MRRRLTVLGLVLLALGLAAGYWFTQVPEEVAEEHRNDALPEHLKVARAVDGVRATLTPATFSAGDYKKTNRADDPEHRPRRQIAAARRTLREVDRERLFVVESRALLDGTGPVEDAKAISRRERAFLRDADEVLDEYEKTVDYAFAFRRLDDRVVSVIARGFAALPNRTVFDPKQLTVPLDRLARRLRPYRRRYLRLKAPRELRADPRRQARAVTVIIQEVRRTAAAFARFDNAGAQAAGRRLTRRLRVNSRRDRDAIAVFVDRSGIRRMLEALNAADTEIRRAYRGL